MYELIILIDSISVKIGIIAFFIIVTRLAVKLIGIKSWERLLTKIIKPASYVFIAAGLIHIVFSLRIAVK